MLPKLNDIEIDRIHGKQGSGRKSGRSNVEVDMNPMVDLAFLLLTFFMLATTFIKPQSMEIVVPAKPKLEDVEKETPIKESKTLNIVLLESKLAWYRGLTDPEPTMVQYDEKLLLQLVETAMKETVGLVILIKPLDESRYENLVQVLDVMAISGVSRYALDRPSEFDISLSEWKE